MTVAELVGLVRAAELPDDAVVLMETFDPHGEFEIIEADHATAALGFNERSRLVLRMSGPTDDTLE